MCPHNPAGCEDCEHERIVQALRASIQRQVDTTPEGRLLQAHDPAAMKSLVDNLVGNVYYVILDVIKKS